jgi:hypothetical protein
VHQGAKPLLLERRDSPLQKQRVLEDASRESNRAKTRVISGSAHDVDDELGEGVVKASGHDPNLGAYSQVVCHATHEVRSAD